MIPVVVGSPIPALRAGLSALIDGGPDMTVWAAAAAPDDLPDALPEGCVIVASPGFFEGWTGSAPTGRFAGAALLLVTDDLDSGGMPQAGLRAWGAITPESPAEALRAAINALAEGLGVFSPELMPGALAPPGAVVPAETLVMAGAIDRAGTVVEALTAREVEVLLRLAEGLTNKQAALALGISEHTVKFHVSSIYSKMGVTNRAEAVREGARRGIVPL